MRPLCLLFAASLAPTTLPAQGTTYLIDNVNVVDVAGGRVNSGQRVVVRGSRITAVGAAATVQAPTGATFVDGNGKFLIPGLWDMHVHAATGPTAPGIYALFLANGVTGVRDMASGVDGTLQWRAATANGTTLGPRIIGAGVLVDGVPIVYPAAITHPVTTAEQARHAVDSLKVRGVDFIKAYEMLRPEVYLALAEQARARGIPYAGHLPLAVSAEDAVRAGHKSFEHLRNLEVACSSKADSLRAVALRMLEEGKDQPGNRLRAAIHGAIRPVAYATQDTVRCQALIRLMAASRAWQTPNLVLGTQSYFRHDTTQFFQKWVAYLPAPQREQWRRTPGQAVQGPGAQAAPAAQRSVSEYLLRMVKQLHDAGVRVLPGTDHPIAVMVPGASLHEELALLVRAGLTPAEALRAGTLNPAEYLGMTDSLGTIANGKLAELVLLDANPLEDIRNVARVQAVWRGGRYLDRRAIDGMLAKLLQ